MNKTKEEIERCKTKKGLQRIIINTPGFVLITLKPILMKKMKELGMV